MSEADRLVAEFLAKRGATKVAEGAKALDYTSKDWAKVVRGEQPHGDYTARRQRYMENQEWQTDGTLDREDAHDVNRLDQENF